MRTLLICLTGIFISPIIFGQSINVPSADIFNDPVWRDRFIGSWGFLSGKEPKISPEEQEIYISIRDFLPDNVAMAAQVLQTSMLSLPPDQPPSAALYFTLGNFYFQTDKRDRAKQNYKKAVDVFPLFLQAYKNLGLLAFQDRNFDESIKYLGKALDLGDTDGRTFGMLGICYHVTEKFIAAEAAYRRAMISDPETDDWKENLARALLQQGKYLEANNMYAQMLTEDPNDVDLWTYQANTYLGMEQMEDAAGNLEILRRMGKADADSLLLLGNIYINKQMIELALDAFLDALKVGSKKDIRDPLRAAEALTNYAAYDEALKLIARIRKVYEGRIEQKDELRMLTLESSIAVITGHGEKAVATLEKIISLDPLNGKALISLARYYGENEEIERAVMTFERASELDEYRSEAFIRLGQLMARLKRWDNAVDYLRQAQDDSYQENVQEFLDQVENIRKVYRATGR